MNHTEYFKLQAKNLLKDYKTRVFCPKDGIYEYNPKFFDITGIFHNLDLNDDKSDFKFTLMNAQHVIAKLAGFPKWDDLLNANPSELELAHLLYDNAHKISLEETVECLHCGERYKFKYVKAIRTKPRFRNDDDFDQIVCKNFPECNGSIIDLFPIE